ncbi:MAG: hypothetical protein Q4G30_00660 [Actinomycetaceae bacterium]|nr:hypothetical protein [Actinomycetaceae bacterium]
MDYMFPLAAVLGIGVWVASYVTVRIKAVRDSLGRGEFGNRILLLMVPGLTLICVGVTVAQALLLPKWALESSWARPLGVGVFLILTGVGFGLVIWSFLPVNVPRWMRPNWLLEEDKNLDRQSIRRVQRRGSSARSSRRRLGWDELEPIMVAGVAIALPRDWPRTIPDVPVVAEPPTQGEAGEGEADDAPQEQEPAKPHLSLLVQATSPGENYTQVQISLWRSQRAQDMEQARAFTQALASPSGWYLNSAEALTIAQSSALECKLTRKEGEDATVQSMMRWVISQRGFGYVLDVFVASTQSEEARQLGHCVAATLVLPAP